MFTQLSPLLKAREDTFTLTVTREGDDQLRVCVLPRLNGPGTDTEKARLNKPLVITGTAAELDGPDLIGQLERYTASAGTLRQTLEEIEAEHKATAAEARKRAAEKSVAAPRKSAAKPAPKASKSKPAKAAPKAPARTPAKANPNNPLLRKTASKVSDTPATQPQPETPPAPPAPRTAEEATQSLL